MIDVFHYRETHIADAPSELAKAINRFNSKYRCYVIGKGANTRNLPKATDILHAHNKIPLKGIRVSKTLVQYHSEPYQVDLRSPARTRLVIAQYHATLPQYANCKIVRNVIDFTTPQYNLNPVQEKIRIGFSPSRTQKMGQWHDKGYSQTVNVLNSIKQIYGDLVDIDIIRGVSLEECIRRKARCNIIIDECVTASYHRSGLEGLALGKLTICSLSPEVERVFLASCGAPNSPFVNVWIKSLELELCKIIDCGIDYIIECGTQNREWMTRYWHPQTIVNEYVKIYDTL
jgi:hypothetical protein